METMTDYPRVLIINCEPLSAKSATGLTMMNLFKEWPEDRLAQLYTHPIVPDVTFKNTKHISICPLNMFKTKHELKRSKNKADHSSQYAFFKVQETQAEAPRITARIYDRIVARLVPIAYLMPYEFSSELHAWIDEFKPDIIYSMLYEMDIMSLVLKISNLYNIPIIPHFMDDWPATQVHRDLFYRGFGRILEKKLKQVLYRSPLGLAIGYAMSVEYSKRYNKEFVSYMNCVDTQKRTVYNLRTENDYRVRFAYVGSFHSNRSVQLCEVASALMDLDKQGIKGEIVLYSDCRANVLNLELTESPVARFASIEESALLETENAMIDAFIHVDSFDTFAIEFLRLSMSSKLPWCMAAGVPIFAYGPPSISTIQYIIRNDIGIVVTERDPEALRENLKKLILNPLLRKSLGSRGRQLAEEKHGAIFERERFKSTLAEVASNWGIEH